MLDHREALPLLACPRCRSSLREREDARLACSEATCRFQDGFPMLGGQPALVDPDTSLLDDARLAASAGASLITRSTGSRLGALARRVLLGHNRVASRFAADVAAAAGPPPLVLVVGGGTVGGGSEALYASSRVRLLSFDIYASASTAFVADAHRIPLHAASVDGVWVQAVLEHVLEPAVVVAEIARVLKPRGWVYAETPFMQQVHEGPFDFTRFTHSGHRWLFRDFEEVASGCVAGVGTQLAWSLEHCGRALTRSRLAGKAIRAAFFWVRWLDDLAGERENLDAASALYFFGRKAARPLSAGDMPGYYRGADHT
jgi:SAM-dependent methyltransferase